MKIGWFAPFYRWVEYCAFGRALERRRFAFLSRLANARRVLVLGEGDGRALVRMLAAAPFAHLDVIDVSSEMLHLARQRIGTSERVRFLQADARHLPTPEQPYDAVVTFFFLDCFEEAAARELVRHVAGLLEPGALWLMSDFALPDYGWRRAHAQAWLWIMYRFFGLTTGLRTRSLPPIAKLLSETGLHRINAQEERAGLIRSEVWQKRPVL